MLKVNEDNVLNFVWAESAKPFLGIVLSLILGMYT